MLDDVTKLAGGISKHLWFYHDDDVKASQRGWVLAKGLSHQSFNTISKHGALHRSLRNSQTQPRALVCVSPDIKIYRLSSNFFRLLKDIPKLFGF